MKKITIKQELPYCMHEFLPTMGKDVFLLSVPFMMKHLELVL